MIRIFYKLKKRLRMKTDYGALTPLIGSWRGTQGRSHMPPDLDIEFTEEMDVTPVGRIDNGKQKLNALYYVRRAYSKKDDSLYHHETGYFIWDETYKRAYREAAIPRGEAYVSASDSDALHFTAVFLANEIGQTLWLQGNMKLVTYDNLMTLYNENGALVYKETLFMENPQTQGKIFAHTLQNTLSKISRSEVSNEA